MKNQISAMGTRRAKITIPRFCVRLGSLSPKVKNSGTLNYSYSTDYAVEQKSSLWDGGDAAKSGRPTSAGSTVMVVVGSSLDGRGALEWALSHAVRSQDTVVLLQVVNSFNKDYLRAQEIMHSMRRICQMRRPEVHVEVAMVAEGEITGQVIVEEAKRRKVSLLVVGQRRRSIMWRLVRRWAGERLRRGGLVDYCINYANCMTIAVRRKSRKLGGYLITTKRHKKFWLLA